MTSFSSAPAEGQEWQSLDAFMMESVVTTKAIYTDSSLQEQGTGLRHYRSQNSRSAAKEIVFHSANTPKATGVGFVVDCFAESEKEN